MTEPASRIVAVRGAWQGSGYLLSARLVLTAAHLLPEEDGEITAIVPGGRGWIRCSVVWRRQDEVCDAALLLAEDDLVRPGAAPGWRDLDLGRLSSLEPLQGCHATGFPALERRSDGRLESHQFLGTISPGTHQLSGRYVLSSADTPPRGAARVWSGMSGAAVFHRGLLVGVVAAELDPDRWQHSRLELTTPVEDIDFNHVVLEHLGRMKWLVPAHQGAAAPNFEAEYAEAVRVDHGTLRIFGLDVSRTSSRPRDLDTAYLSLEASPVSGRSDGPQRVERALSGRRRVLLRGLAGSGKSTLIQWLAVHAVAGTLGEELREWNGRIPFVLRLRSMYRLGKLRPRPAEFLEIDGSRLADSQPPGWADGVLSGGRGLLLVDGLDEIPEPAREEAEEWLAGLLRHYPGLHCLVTVRPSAVPPDFLAHLDFDELTLCPMNPHDRRELVERWHAAVAAELGDEEQAYREHRQLVELKDTLLRRLDTTPELAAITDSPLLCAMICTLHREWDGVLPSRRMEVYEAALNMLLVRRDQQRRIGAVEGVELGKAEQVAVLQRIAAWLTINSQVEADRSDGARQIAQLLPTLSLQARPGTADQIFNHLLNRTGLLSASGEDTFEFVHRTFQDYLAAREFADDRDFGLLLRESIAKDWSDVIRMTVWHCSPRDRAELLTALLPTKDTGGMIRSWRRVLAATCLPYAPVLDVSVRAQVLRQLGETLRSGHTWLGRYDWGMLAIVGDEVIPVLPAKATPQDADEPWYLSLATSIGGPQALAWLAERAPELTAYEASYLTADWPAFDLDGYARQVLARADLSQASIGVTRTEELPYLAAFGPIDHLDLPADSLALAPGCLTGVDVNRLSVHSDSRLADLSFLSGIGRVGKLSLRDCPAIADFSQLAALPLHGLTIEIGPDTDVTELGRPLARMPALRTLSLRFHAVPAEPLDLAPLDGAVDVEVHTTADLPVETLVSGPARVWLREDGTDL